MGKKTLYHPLPLSVLRGATEYCGWTFGRIEQISSDREQGLAIYRCDIAAHPRAAEEWPVKTIKKHIQHCFADDVTVTSVVVDSEKGITAYLMVMLVTEFTDPMHDKQLEGGLG